MSYPTYYMPYCPCNPYLYTTRYRIMNTSYHVFRGILYVYPTIPYALYTFFSCNPIYIPYDTVCVSYNFFLAQRWRTCSLGACGLGCGKSSGDAEGAPFRRPRYVWPSRVFATNCNVFARSLNHTLYTYSLARRKRSTALWLGLISSPMQKGARLVHIFPICFGFPWFPSFGEGLWAINMEAHAISRVRKNNN